MAYMKQGLPWLYDNVTNDLVGVKDQDGSETYFSTMSNGYTNTAIPVNGGNSSFTDNNSKGMLLVKPAGNLATGNIVLPTDAKSDIGQELFVAFFKAITLTTVVNGTIMGDPGLAGLGDVWHLKKLDVGGIWGKIN